MNISGSDPQKANNETEQRTPKANKSCVPCRVRKVKCDATVIGLPCSSCTSRQCTKDCVLPVRKGRSRWVTFPRLLLLDRTTACTILIPTGLIGRRHTSYQLRTMGRYVLNQILNLGSCPSTPSDSLPVPTSGYFPEDSPGQPQPCHRHQSHQANQAIPPEFHCRTDILTPYRSTRVRSAVPQHPQ